jgi:formylmethanofuran dehydrogenase subunit E
MVQRRRHWKSRAPTSNRSRRPKSYKVVCSGCGKEVITQAPAPNDKKLLCIECFGK